MSVLEGKNILVIDDSTTIVCFLQELLSREGSTVDAALTGTEGLDKHARNSYDLILLDLLLPDIGGIEVLEHIRTRGRKTTVVMLTGAGDVRTVLAAMRAGADGYSEKKDLLGQNEADMFFYALGQAMQYRSSLVAREELQEKLLYVSFHDPLTDLFNRAFFEEELVRMESSRRYPMTVVVADVNWLKLTNDRLGHLAGDELLRRAAKVLRATFRPDDLIARIGGDEFVVVLPNTTEQTASSIPSRVERCLTVDNATALPPLSLAVGTATTETPGTLFETFKQADAAMYACKERQKADGCPWLDRLAGMERILRDGKNFSERRISS